MTNKEQEEFEKKEFEELWDNFFKTIDSWPEEERRGFLDALGEMAINSMMYVENKKKIDD